MLNAFVSTCLALYLFGFIISAWGLTILGVWAKGTRLFGIGTVLVWPLWVGSTFARVLAGVHTLAADKIKR